MPLQKRVRKIPSPRPDYALHAEFAWQASIAQQRAQYERRVDNCRRIRLYLDRMKRERQNQAQNALSCVLGQTESVLPNVPIVPNLYIVKKEPIDYTEEILSSESQSMPSIQNLCSSMLSVKLEHPDDCMDDITVPVHPDDIALPVTPTDAVENSPMLTSHTCVDSTEPPKGPNLSLSPSTSNIEIKNEFFMLREVSALRVTNFVQRWVAQHHITNMVEMENLNEESLPMISKISSFQKH